MNMKSIETVSVTNNHNAPRGVPNHLGTIVEVKPGESRSIVMNYGMYKRLKGISFAEFSDWPEVKQEKTTQKGTKTVSHETSNPGDNDSEEEMKALRIKAAELEIDVDGRWGADRLAEEINKAIEVNNALHNPDGA